MIARVVALAALALLGVYLYAAAALWAHARLARLPPPRSLAHAIGVGALLPACGCTALPYARRAPPRLRAPFLVAAYAVNPLLLVAAALLRGGRGVLAVLALALVAALAARLAPEGERPRARLDDLLLRRDGAPWRDAAPYAAAFAAPALGAGAALGLAQHAPAAVEALALGALAVAFAPPWRALAEDHGPRLARWVVGAHLAFAAALAAAALLA